MTTPVVLVVASQSVLSEPQESSYDAIVAAMARAGQGKATWIGPAPRITRFFNALGNNEVWAAWPARLPEATPAAANALGNAVSAALQGVSSSWTRAAVFDYRPDLSGPEEFWTSGQAAASRTSHEQNRADQRDENPYGPDSVIEEMRRRDEDRDRQENPTPLWLIALPWVALFGLGAWGLSKAAEASHMVRRNPNRGSSTRALLLLSDGFLVA